MRAQLNIYGDGVARGTHMSLFLVLLKGEHDDIIPWPFNFPVMFCLYDQINQKHHIVDSFCPDTTSNSFQRPFDQNLPSGILKFCPLQIIEQEGNCYVQGDTLYIKIAVDFCGTPRRLLSYTSSLNPGLPTHVQEDMCRREIEKYKQLRAAVVAVTNQNDQEVSQSSLTPVHLQVHARNRQQPSILTTDSQSITCEDISDDE